MFESDIAAKNAIMLPGETLFGLYRPSSQCEQIYEIIHRYVQKNSGLKDTTPNTVGFGLTIEQQWDDFVRCHLLADSKWKIDDPDILWRFFTEFSTVCVPWAIALYIDPISGQFFPNPLRSQEEADELFAKINTYCEKNGIPSYKWV